MADDIVRLAEQLFAGEAADGDEGVVAVGDLAVEVGGGNQSFIGTERALPLGNRQILAHD
ncbi:hypothetical protein D3C80_2016580 [compost metagenome]